MGIMMYGWILFICEKRSVGNRRIFYFLFYLFHMGHGNGWLGGEVGGEMGSKMDNWVLFGGLDLKDM